MSRVAIVVLNYLNYMDTIECVDSILKMEYPICGIVIVDNGSKNDSYTRLKKKYAKEKKVSLIANKKNLGFARGNNEGIFYARKKLKADFVLVVNNDTVFIEKNYIKSMIQKYEPGVGVIGSKIVLKNGSVQPEMVGYLDFKDIISCNLNMVSLRYGSCFDFPLNQGKATIFLHGCALMFTPDFFKAYKGFYKRTFLYGEEDILYFMCKCKNLRQVYNTETKIYHKEDQSSLMSFQNDKLIHNRYALRSRKYILLWKIKYEIRSFLSRK